MSSESPLSPEVVAWLLQVVNGMSVNVGAPDFAEAAALAQQAKAELAALVQQESA